MQTKILLIVSIFFAFASPAFAQTGEAGKIDEFGDVNCEEGLYLLDNFINKLQDNPGATGTIIYYGGKSYVTETYNKKTKTYKKVVMLPRRNESEARVHLWRVHFRFRGFDTSTIKFIDGGYREKHTIELWLVPKGVEPPKPTPTLNEKEIKFRKGKATDDNCGNLG